LPIPAARTNSVGFIQHPPKNNCSTKELIPDRYKTQGWRFRHGFTSGFRLKAECFKSVFYSTE
ncbi:MAG: hypothetical protein MR932_08735, partial [Treponema porcinum]|nr:hypothetical protein [Treponema porcinum]